MADTEAPTAPVLPAKQVVYCGVCTLPPEYCEFGGTTQKCADWLLSSHPSLHARLYDPNAIASNLSALSTEAQARADKDAAKKAAKASAAEAKESERLAHARVTITRIERTKRKFVTTVSGLEEHGLDLKKVAKEMGKKFATGASVTKTPTGGEEITVQGDVGADLEEWILEKYKDVPEDLVDFVEEKKKKK